MSRLFNSPGDSSASREPESFVLYNMDLILLHVEVQSHRESDFAARMCVYKCRIWGHCNKPVVSLLLLVDAVKYFGVEKSQTPARSRSRQTSGDAQIRPNSGDFGYGNAEPAFSCQLWEPMK